jgi:hypothetical protein
MNARDALEMVAAGCDKLAAEMPGNLEKVLRQQPNAPEREKVFITGYCEGHIKSYRGLAEDLRKVLRENPGSGSTWPRIGIGIGFLWPIGGSN